MPALNAPSAILHYETFGSDGTPMAGAESATPLPNFSLPTSPLYAETAKDTHRAFLMANKISNSACRLKLTMRV
ncbi:hypothetical protein FNYG_14304 [Fusarium nygamai]|uniref:Uncharacterized protein n=1 Tax=Gibberella nygamai TaxID=42673 RepID=A0A2K0UT66_GIBNY|nr:hypothetical protein FNYG_14304 [Fusarium nygamai]